MVKISKMLENTYRIKINLKILKLGFKINLKNLELDSEKARTPCTSVYGHQSNCNKVLVQLT